MPVTPTPGTSAGRPRDPRIEEAVLAATRDLLARDGYDCATIDAIAKAADVSRPAIYRRWPTRAHVVFAAAFPVPEDEPVLARSGDPIADLRGVVRGALDLWARPAQAAASAGILAEWRTHPELRERMASRLDDVARSEFRALVADGVAAGVFRPDVDADAVFALISAHTFFAVHVRNRTDADDVEAELLGVLLPGLRP